MPSSGKNLKFFIKVVASLPKPGMDVAIIPGGAQKVSRRSLDQKTHHCNSLDDATMTVHLFVKDSITPVDG